MKKLLFLLIAVLMTAPTHALELSGTYTITSDYIWRGISQTNEDPAFQLGVEKEYNGFYGGLWASGVDIGIDTNVEVDLYGGYAGSFKGISYDIGYMTYNYDGGANLDFEERYISLGYGPLTIGHHRDKDNGLEYNYVDMALSFIPVVDVSLHYGEYDGVKDKAISMDYDLPYNLSLGVMYNNGALDDSIIVSIGGSF